MYEDVKDHGVVISYPPELAASAIGLGAAMDRFLIRHQFRFLGEDPRAANRAKGIRPNYVVLEIGMD